MSGPYLPETSRTHHHPLGLEKRSIYQKKEPLVEGKGQTPLGNGRIKGELQKVLRVCTKHEENKIWAEVDKVVSDI